MANANEKVDPYFAGLKQWKKELEALRKIVLACGLSEELKWRQPCYTHDGKNVAILGELKDCCVISFFKGALLKDPAGVLSKPGENTRAARVIRITSLQEVAAHEKVLKQYLAEAIEIEKRGKAFDFAEHRDDQETPAELLAKFDEHPALEAAFEALTPGRRRAYLMHFNAAKQSATRTSRIDACTPKILIGKGMNDCTCGLTKRPPGCDGSHKQLA